MGKIPWRRKWPPTAVFLPGESHGQRSLEGHSPWGGKESDTPECTRTNREQGLSTFSLCAPLSLGPLRTPEGLPHHSIQKSFCLDSPVSHPLWRNPTQLFPAMPNNTSPWESLPTHLPAPRSTKQTTLLPVRQSPSVCCPPRVCSLDWVLNLGREVLAQLSLTRMWQKYLWN